MAARVRDIANPGCIEKETKFYFLKEELLRIYCNAVIEKCYFCNSNYKNENLMEVAAFKSLFNFQNIRIVNPFASISIVCELSRYIELLLSS